MEAYLKGLELGRKHYFVRAPQFRPYFRLAGAALVLYALKMSYAAMGSRRAVARKLERMSGEARELKGAELVRPPWVGDYAQWRDRLVVVEGRPIHRDAFLVPSTHDSYEGFQYIVPIVTREDENLEHRSGLLVNLGWMPHEYRRPEMRPVADSFESIRVLGVVTRGEDHDRRRLFKGGNAYDEQRHITGNLSLEDMAATTGFENQQECRAALVEQIDLSRKTDVLGQPHYNRDLSDTVQPPYARTLAGFLLTEPNFLERVGKQALLVAAGSVLLCL